MKMKRVHVDKVVHNLAKNIHLGSTTSSKSMFYFVSNLTSNTLLQIKILQRAIMISKFFQKTKTMIIPI